MKQVVVTGANGFIGSNLVKELISNEIKVYAIVRNCKSNIDRLPLESDLLEIVYCELDDIDKLKLPCGAMPEIWIHLAWQDCNTSNRANYSIQVGNVTNAIKSMNLAYQMGCKRFICVGTVAEYTIPYVLTGKVTAQNCVYAITKDYANKILSLESQKLGIEYIWCRLSNIYGCGDETNNLVRYTINSLKNGGIPEYTSAMQPYNFLNIIDCRKALVKIAFSEKYVSQVFVGGDEVKLLKDFLIEIRDIIDENAEMGFGKRPDDGAVYESEWFDNSVLKQVFDYYPEITFKEGILQIKNEYFDEK